MFLVGLRKLAPPAEVKTSPPRMVDAVGRNEGMSEYLMLNARTAVHNKCIEVGDFEVIKEFVCETY